MPKYCSVPGCKNDSASGSDRKSFYKKTTEPSEKKPKRLRANGHQNTAVSDDRTLESAVHLYHITDGSPVEVSDLLQTHGNMMEPADTCEAGAHFPFMFLHAVDDDDDVSCGDEKMEVVLMAECPACEGQLDLVNGLTSALLAQSHRLAVGDGTLCCAEDTMTLLATEVATRESLDVLQDTQVIAYFETIPNVFPCESSNLVAFPADTVLSSALSSTPITSTVPIVSKHLEPSPLSLVLTVQRLGDGRSEEDGMEQQDHQVEEHCYDRSSLSKEQLEAIVVQLQRKVKVLQQRHRRHLEKLLVLENMVNQLRQSNLLNEELLQLLERACIQTCAAVTDAGEPVTIIYVMDPPVYVLMDMEEMP